MKARGFKSLTITMNRTSLQRLVVYTVIGIIGLFILIGVLTSVEPRKSFASTTLHDLSNYITGENLVYMMGMENNYFTQSLPEESRPPQLSSIAFNLATSVNPDDPRSLLGRELPGFALFDGRMVVAGEGSDYTTMPIESPPPLEVLLAEREANTKQLEELDKPIQNDIIPERTTDGKKVIHVVHSHSRESYLPELEGVTDPNKAWHSELNITLVGERLGKSLESRGIGVDVDKSDIQTILQQRGWDYIQSYDATREIIKNAKTNNPDIEFFFDLHRDSQPRNITTVNINGVEYAKTIFVVGRDNSNYEHNLKVARELHELIDKKYPGLSRGVYEVRGSRGTNGNFNQDLSKQSLLLEVGGVENTLEETFRTADAFAEVFSEYYWQNKDQ